MKSNWAIFWFVISLVLGGALLVQTQQRKRQDLQKQVLQVQVEKLANSARVSEAEVGELKKEQMQLRGELAAAHTPVATSQSVNSDSSGKAISAATGPASGKGKESAGKGSMANILGNMMKDPEMRKGMEQQQRMAVNMIYGSLLKELQLNPEQEQKFKDLLLQQQMAGISNATAMMEGSASDRAAVASRIEEEQKERDSQLKQLLGEDKFAQLQEYNQTLGERMMLDQFGKDLQMTPDQRDQLLGIMREEKKNIQINTGTDPAALSKDPQALLGSSEAVEKILSQQELINARVLERAGQVLSPEQVRQLEPVLKSHIEMQRAGVKMARQMFGSEKGAGLETPPDSSK